MPRIIKPIETLEELANIIQSQPREYPISEWIGPVHFGGKVVNVEPIVQGDK